MAYISEEFLRQIKQNPQSSYAVLITLKGRALPQSLEGKGKYVLENKIYSTEINGADIDSLSQNNDIEAIEPDVEMNIM